MKMITHYPEQAPRLCIYFKKTSAAIPLDHSLMLLVRRAIKVALEYENISKNTEFSFTCCQNDDIQALNSVHRGKDKPTDVLSFPLYEDRDQIDAEQGLLTLGDIVVSYERAAEQAKELGHSTDREIAFLTIHSVLHLLGYDHERSKEEDELMCAKQKEILRLLYERFYLNEN